jgi:hypothetical protein
VLPLQQVDGQRQAAPRDEPSGEDLPGSITICGGFTNFSAKIGLFFLEIFCRLNASVMINIEQKLN